MRQGPHRGPSFRRSGDEATANRTGRSVSGKDQVGARWRRGALWALVAVAGSGVLISRVLADVGVAVSYGRLDLPLALEPGQRVELRPLGVSNPGSQTTTYQMGFGAIHGQKERSPSASWFSFAPREVTLAPRETRYVRIFMRPAPTAAQGRYQGLLKAQIVQREHRGATVGGAAAARLTFRIGAPRISVSVTPRRVRAGQAAVLRFAVTSVLPQCESGVVIAVAGRHAVTDARGRATVYMPARRAGVERVVAHKRGCRSATTAVRVG